MILIVLSFCFYPCVWFVTTFKGDILLQQEVVDGYKGKADTKIHSARGRFYSAHRKAWA